MSTPERSRRLRVGIDTGGTFTDVVAVDEATGEVFTTKTPSIPEVPSRAVLEGLRKVLRLAGQSAEAVAAVSHGMTVATNALLEERFDGVALVTTAGFRHVLEIARQSVPGWPPVTGIGACPGRCPDVHCRRCSPRYTDGVDAPSVRRFVDRPWELLRATKRRYWAEETVARGPDAPIRASRALWLHMRRVRPDWPSDAERAEDLAHHLELKGCLDRAARALARLSHR